jgi:hypothetical protein
MVPLPSNLLSLDIKQPTGNTFGKFKVTGVLLFQLGICGLNYKTISAETESVAQRYFGRKSGFLRQDAINMKP